MLGHHTEETKLAIQTFLWLKPHYLSLTSVTNFLQFSLTSHEDTTIAFGRSGVS